MPRVGVSDGQYPPRMMAVGEPGGEFSADRAARGFVGAARFSGDDEDDAGLARGGAVERARQGAMRSGEIVTVEVDDHVGLDAAGAEGAFPVFGEGGAG